jgi:hypothetical protein
MVSGKWFTEPQVSLAAAAAIAAAADAAIVAMNPSLEIENVNDFSIGEL